MRALIVAFSLSGLLALGANAAEPVVSDIAVIPIHDGVNVIPRFAADGRAATIVKAWRDNGNAHGYSVYLVTLPVKDDYGAGHKTGVVGFDDGGAAPFCDTATASPFDGERVLQTLRFARAKIDGAPAVVMIRADLGEAKSGVLADHAPADIRIYKLEHPGVDVGTTPDVFRLVSKTRAPGLYCNADVALAVELHLPPPDTPGRGPGGCFD